MHINCNIYSSNPNGCVHNSKCGWCGQNNNCVEGTPSGPLAPCLKNTYLYTAPNGEWDPFRSGTINVLAVDEKNRPLVHITHEPDFKKMNLFNPYN